MSRVLVCITQGFNGAEMFAMLHTLTERGHTFDVVAPKKGYIWDDFDLKKPYKLNKDYWDDDVFDYDGLVVITGDPKLSRKAAKDWRLRRIVLAYKDKPVASICTAVSAIRWICEGKRVAAFPLLRVREQLSDAGAIVTRLSVCVDGNIVTAESQVKSEEWSNFFCDLLEGKTPDFNLKDSGYLPVGIPRYTHPEIVKLQQRTERANESTTDQDG
jgi:hypothetical protein